MIGFPVVRIDKNSWGKKKQIHTHGIASMVATDFCDWDDEKVQRMIQKCEEYLSREYEVSHVQ